MESIKALWAWCLASTSHAFVALAVLGFFTNVWIRFFTSKAWEEFQAKHPRVAGVCIVLKGAFPEVGLVARGLLQAVKGELQKRAGTQDPDALAKKVTEDVTKALADKIERPTKPD